MSYLFGLEQLEAATSILTSAAPSRSLLVIAWEKHLALIAPSKDLPAELRERFRALPGFGARLPINGIGRLNATELRLAFDEVVALRDEVRGRLRSR
jgi:hypothetical protein